jgi:hypothetical protein
MVAFDAMVPRHVRETLAKVAQAYTACFGLLSNFSCPRTLGDKVSSRGVVAECWRPNATRRAIGRMRGATSTTDEASSCEGPGDLFEAYASLYAGGRQYRRGFSNRAQVRQRAFACADAKLRWSRRAHNKKQQQRHVNTQGLNLTSATLLLDDLTFDTSLCRQLDRQRQEFTQSGAIELEASSDLGFGASSSVARRSSRTSSSMPGSAAVVQEAFAAARRVRANAIANLQGMRRASASGG